MMNPLKPAIIVLMSSQLCRRSKKNGNCESRIDVLYCEAFFANPRINTSQSTRTDYPMLSITIAIPDILATDRLGRLLAESLPNGGVVALIGTLGAGKTTLVQSIAKYTECEDIVSSPTFVLLHEYTTGTRPIYHFDAYRLEREEEFRHLSPDDYFEGVGVTFIEWADKFPSVLPANHLAISIELLDSEQRQIHITGFGPEYEAVVQALGT